MSDISPILERFAQRTISDRAALLQFARETSLHYGPWQQFKKLYKLAEAPALGGAETDVALLGALLARVDAAPIPDKNQPHLEPLEGAPPLFKPQAVRLGERSFAVGGRNSDGDTDGWRLETGGAPNAEKTGGFFAALKSAFAPSAGAQAKRVYDFNAREHMGTDREIAARDHALEIAVKGYRGNHTFRVDVSDPAFAFLENSGPSAPTWQYMKRRARRLLRKLSAARPELYRALLHAMLREVFALNKNAPLNPATQWASMDALFAQSTRWRQTPAARGPYVLTEKKFHFKTREERAPEIWNNDVGWTREMVSDETIPAEANAAALGVLRANNQEIPQFSQNQLQHFLDSDLPILQTHATRVVTKLPDLESQPPQLLAAALLLGGAGTRRKIEEVVQGLLQAGSTPGAWREAFALQLAKALEKRGSRCADAAAQMLARSFQSEISDAVVFAHLQMFLEISGADSNTDNDWIFERIRQKGASGELSFLDAIAALPEQFRERVLTEFSRRAANSKPQAKDVLALITKDDAAQNRIGWRFLEATAMEGAQIQELWKTFSRRYYAEPIFAAAFGEEASAQLWRRANWQPNDAFLLINSRGHLWQSYARFFCAEFLCAAIESLPAKQQLDFVLKIITRLESNVAEQVFQTFQNAAKTYAPSPEKVRFAFTYSPYHRTRSETEAAWKFLECSAVSPATLREVWRDLWSADAPTAAFGVAAAGVLRCAQIPAHDFADWLQTAPIEKFSPAFFLTLLELLAPAQKAALLLRPSENQWPSLRRAVLNVLQTDADLRAAFWNGVWDGLGSAPDLLARFDDEMLSTFNALPAAAIGSLLPTASGVHETLAMNWLLAHEDEMLRDENLETLIITATHAIEAIRLWGLRHARERGLSVALALRLMESGLPQPFALGREYFESAPRNSSQERDYALALCDSPQSDVQHYGREFIARRANSLLDAAMLQNLAEHPDPQMQNWVATQIGEFPAVATADFDAAILRARGRARRAKENVKTRIGVQAGSTPGLNAAALLELARGSLARDREWALQQLAKRALSGEEIDGVAIERDARETVSRGDL